MQIGRFNIETWQDWTDLFRRDKPYRMTFTIVNLSHERVLGKTFTTTDIAIALLGFNLCIAWTSKHSEQPIEHGGSQDGA